MKNFHFTTFNFFQLLRLLKKDGKIPILKSSSSLAFPCSDIRNMGENYIEINFLGLLGTNSPLPFYLTENINVESSQAWKDFLNLFNHQIYILFFLFLKKYNPIVQPLREKFFYLYYLKKINIYRLNKEYLLNKIKIFMKTENVKINDFFIKKSKLKNPTYFTADHSLILGDNTIIGEYIYQTKNFIQIIIALHSIPAKKIASLSYIVKRYLGNFYYFQFLFLITIKKYQKNFIGDTILSSEKLKILGEKPYQKPYQIYYTFFDTFPLREKHVVWVKDKSST